MSNWSVVMVSWSGIDKEAEGKSLKHEDRWNEIIAKFGEAHDYCFFDEMTLGNAVECVGLFGANHFAPDELVEVLRSFAWDYPYAVEIHWKSEDFDRFLKVPAFPEYRDDNETPWVPK